MNKRRFTHTSTPIRRQQILQAALQCFDADGIEYATMEQIREIANCSIGSIYHHFGGKEGIASQLYLEGVQLQHQHLCDILKQSTCAQDGIKDFVQAYGQWVSQHSAWARFILHSRDIDFSEQVCKQLREVQRDFYNEVFAWFKPHVQKKRVQRLPAEAYTPLLLGPIRDYARYWLITKDAKDLHLMATIFAETAWRALGHQSVLS